MQIILAYDIILGNIKEEIRMSFRKIILNLIYPPHCVFCGKRLSPKSYLWVCDKCARELPYANLYTRCSRCGKPIPDSASGICKTCYINKNHNIKMTAPFVYMDLASRAIVTFKKERNSGNASTLSEYVVNIIKRDFGGVIFDYVISVPPRKKKRSERGSYDQAACLARAVARKLHLPYIANAMVQTRRLSKQSSLSYHRRFENVRGAFAVRKPELTQGKTILLIDDVCTTGATLEECAKTLKASGVLRVYSATIATVPSN